MHDSCLRPLSQVRNLGILLLPPCERCHMFLQPCTNVDVEYPDCPITGAVMPMWCSSLPADGAAFFDNLASTPPRAGPTSPGARQASSEDGSRLGMFCPSTCVHKTGLAGSDLGVCHQRIDPGARSWARDQCRSGAFLHSPHIPPNLPAAPPSPRNAGIVDGPPGEKEGDIQKLLFVGNFDGAVDACFAVSANHVCRPDCTSQCIRMFRSC